MQVITSISQGLSPQLSNLIYNEMGKIFEVVFVNLVELNKIHTGIITKFYAIYNSPILLDTAGLLLPTIFLAVTVTVTLSPWN